MTTTTRTTRLLPPQPRRLPAFLLPPRPRRLPAFLLPLRPRRLPAFLLVAVSVLALVAAAGCGDNLCAPGACGTPDGGGTPEPFVASSITFEPAAPAGDARIWLAFAEADLARNQVTLQLRGDGLAAYGVAGRLLFDTSQCTLEDATADDGLSQGGTELLAAAAGNRQGGFFGVTRSLGERLSVSLDGSQSLATLTFAVTGPGRTAITFNEIRSLVIDHEAKPVPVDAWLGGTLVVE